MKRMVALASPTLNESYVEPSPYAWLRTCAPVPTTYAPACESLYPFQEILEKRTSRARGMTVSCTEVSERKFQICIEIWQVELENCVWRVSFHKYAYVHGDPIQGVDPTGEFMGLVLGLGVQMMLPGPGDFVMSGLESLVKAYVSNLEWDMEWALDMSLPDSWGSRLDDSWVYSALGQGMHDAFNVHTPFGSFNPLDMFGGAADSFAAKGLLGPSGGVSRAFFRGGHAAKHSLTTVIQYGQDAASPVKRFSATVSYFFHSKLGQHIVRFPEYVKAAKVKIRPTVPPGGRAWENLSDIEQGMMSKSDIFAATERLRKNNGGRLPAGMDEVVDSSGRPTGQLWVGDVPHTWHHSHRKGEMELIPTQLHRESIKNQMPQGEETVGPHIGHALWWKNLW